MFETVRRILNFAARFCVGIHHFGLAGACRAFFGHHWSSNDTLVSVPMRQLGRRFWFRARSDRPVLGLFYNEGYRVIDAYGPLARVIVDAGANIGDSTLRFRRFHPSATIIAIEADADNHAVLEKNFADDPKVSCLHRALWHEAATLHVQKTWANVASRAGPASTGTSSQPVAAISVPGLMQELGLAEIDILKLDIEGAESVVFKTADTSWLHRVRCIIFECCDADDPGTTMAIFDVLIRAGVRFNCHVSGESIILIRQDTRWLPGSDLWLEEKATVLPHLAEYFRSEGIPRLDAS